MSARSRLAHLLGRGSRSGPAAPPKRYTFAGALTDAERAVIAECRPFTMTSVERIVATMDAVEHVVRRGLPGALVECGVWRGGSVLAMLRTLQRLGVDDRDVVLFDTFEGMTEPTDADTSSYDPAALAAWRDAQAEGRKLYDWLFTDELFGQAQVEALLASTGYPPERVHLVPGPVESTLPREAPAQIAVLRLDTDWYESTRHELVHLWPRIVAGGVLLVDDYGHWDGCRRAVDEYFEQHPPAPLMSRTDYTGRLIVKESTAEEDAGDAQS